MKGGYTKTRRKGEGGETNHEHGQLKSPNTRRLHDTALSSPFVSRGRERDTVEIDRGMWRYSQRKHENLIVRGLI